jgi:hypothetical protein
VPAVFTRIVLVKNKSNESTIEIRRSCYDPHRYLLSLPALTWVNSMDMDPFIFSPDISMLGYLVNARTGAFIYNFFHHKGIAILLTAAGYYFKLEVLLSIGILLFAHASFDRIWGYGLKYASDFKDTHLGSLEKKMIPTTLP